MHDDGVLYNIHNDELRINCLIESIIVLRMITVDIQRGKNDLPTWDPSQVSAREMR